MDAGVLGRPTTEPRRISDDSSERGTSGGPRQGDQGPQRESGKRSGRPANSALPPMQQRRGRPPKQGPPHQDLNQVVKALAKLALQQETALKVLRQDTTWIIFIQPGPTSSLALLLQVAQKWKQSQTKGAVDRPLRSVLITRLFEHLLKMPRNLKDPLLAKAKDQNWLTEEGWRYQTWSPSLGALVPCWKPCSLS